MATFCKSILDFLKIDFFPTFKNSLLISSVYLLMIPVIRGISNLDNTHSAKVLGESIALIGSIIFISIIKRELETGIKEMIYTKVWTYMKSIIIRFICGFIIITVMIVIFALVMKSHNCIFSYWEYVIITIFYAIYLGLLGLVFSQIGHHAVIGYLSALGYWSLHQLQIIHENSVVYMFPIVNGVIEYSKLFILFIVIICLLALFLILMRYSHRKV